MEVSLPRVSIIVPTKPGQAEIKSVTAALRLDYPKGKIEILVARGRQPAVQRNCALRAADGDLIYFLDDDSQPSPEVLRRAVDHFCDPEVQMVGGPNLCPPDAPFLEQVFAVVLASWIAFGPSRARYDRVGGVRTSGEKELILCNLLTRRTALLEAGGFDESLYPNEENALMDELQKRGGRLIYDPAVSVLRRPRPTLFAFGKMLLNYGRGRAEQFRLHPTPGSAMNFVPPLFVLFLLLTPLWLGLGWFHVSRSSDFYVTPPPDRMRSESWSVGLAWFPLVAYAAALGLQTIVNFRKGLRRAVCAVPLLFATHLFYGLGFWRGLFTRVHDPKMASTEVVIESIQP